LAGSMECELTNRLWARSGVDEALILSLPAPLGVCGPCHHGHCVRGEGEMEMERERGRGEGNRTAACRCFPPWVRPRLWSLRTLLKPLLDFKDRFETPFECQVDFPVEIPLPGGPAVQPAAAQPLHEPGGVPHPPTSLKNVPIAFMPQELL
jgi:hypothetical protein